MTTLIIYSLGYIIEQQILKKKINIFTWIYYWRSNVINNVNIFFWMMSLKYETSLTSHSNYIQPNVKIIYVFSSKHNIPQTIISIKYELPNLSTMNILKNSITWFQQSIMNTKVSWNYDSFICVYFEILLWYTKQKYWR